MSKPVLSTAEPYPWTFLLLPLRHFFSHWWCVAHIALTPLPPPPLPLPLPLLLNYGGQVDKLTGRPLPEDVLQYAVPMCGPYAAFSSFKYKVKLTPGTGKKGKSAKQAVDVFTRMKECSSAERSLMRALTDPEMVAIMIGDVKLSMPGLFQAQRQKKGKK